MSIYNRFFGKRAPDDGPDDLVAGPKKEDCPALQVLFADNFQLDPAAVTQAMQMQIGADDYLRCRAPTKDEPWLESKGEMLVVEVIRADQINR